MLRAYEAFLARKGTVKTQYVPFYLKWVSDCYALVNEPFSTLLNIEQKQQFLSYMAKRHEDWQVKQADAALRLYDYFLSRNRVSTIDEPSSYEERCYRKHSRLGHHNLQTTMIYTHVASKNILGVRSPLDRD
jgi:hypothetical protein